MQCSKIKKSSTLWWELLKATRNESYLVVWTGNVEMQLLVTFSYFLSWAHGAAGLPGLCVSLETHFFSWKKSCPNWGGKKKRESFFSPLTPGNAKDSDVNMYTNRLLELRSEKLPAPSFHGGARRVSGPGLRTAPALPTPCNPNLHTPASRPSLTAEPANHNANLASTSPPTLDRIGWAGEGGADWLMGIPWANDAPHVLPVDQWGGSVKRRRARGADDHMFNFN